MAVIFLRSLVKRKKKNENFLAKNGGSIFSDWMKKRIPKKPQNLESKKAFHSLLQDRNTFISKELLRLPIKNSKPKPMKFTKKFSTCDWILLSWALYQFYETFQSSIFWNNLSCIRLWNGCNISGNWMLYAINRNFGKKKDGKYRETFMGADRERKQKDLDKHVAEK